VSSLKSLLNNLYAFDNVGNMDNLYLTNVI